MACTTNNMAAAARRTLSTAHVLAAAGRSANRALTSGCNPASEAITPTASSRRSNEAGKRRSRPGTPLATIEASRMASPAHTDSATAAPRTPQRRITSCVSGYPQALSPRTTDPIARFITSALGQVRADQDEPEGGVQDVEHVGNRLYPAEHGYGRMPGLREPGDAQDDGEQIRRNPQPREPSPPWALIFVHDLGYGHPSSRPAQAGP
jgi:hypothetical protein